MSSNRLEGALAATLLICATSCFPTLPNEYEITNLRVLAVQASPANLLLNQWPIPPITMNALVVDPDDPDLENVEHTWELDVPDDFEGAEELEALLPDGPYGTSLAIDLSVLFGARDTTWTQGLLPFRYTAKNDSLTREAIKFAYFLVPEIDLGDDDDSAPGDDDDSAPGDDDDSAPGDDDDAGPPAPAEPELPPEYNENPRLLTLTVGDAVFSLDAGTLPGTGGPLYVGEVDAEEGLRFEIEVLDDKSPNDVSAEVYWTHGTPGLPSNDPLSELRGDDDDDDDGGGGGFGGDSASLNTTFLGPDREFGWTPPDEAPSNGPVRLFLILVDDDGGVSWQEIRPEDAPN